MVYRDDHLAALRASGRDAEREAGRLSLDEVRQHLSQSVLPRLAGDGVIAPPRAAGAPWASIRFSERVWQEIAATRDEVATAFRETGEHPASLPSVDRAERRRAAHGRLRSSAAASSRRRDSSRRTGGGAS